jgi:RimJ/RimL family protein N-acetyltransferase
MDLETTRLRIVPLTVEQFRLLLCGMDKLEEALKLIPSGESLDSHTQQAMDGLFKEALNHSDNYWWYTNWQIILKSENRLIGSACFMKEPDENGEVEIGYGIHDKYWNKGFMTETVKAICEWALLQDNVKSVIAETEINNYSSHRVLEKSALKRFLHTDESIWWKITNLKNNI